MGLISGGAGSFGSPLSAGPETRLPGSKLHIGREVGLEHGTVARAWDPQGGCVSYVNRLNYLTFLSEPWSLSVRMDMITVPNSVGHWEDEMW